MNYVESFNLFGVEAKQIPCIQGEGAPTTSTEGAVGCFYMDTTDGTLYKCIAVAGGNCTWETIEGVKGDTGDKGDPGTTPHIGENGNWYIGDVDTGVSAGYGASAYDLAKNNGFEGTEEEWLASLKGEKGEHGENGEVTTDELNKTFPAVGQMVREGRRDIQVTWEVGGFNSTGSLTNAGFRTVDYIPVNDGEIPTVGFKSAISMNIYVVEYDENKQFIARSSVGYPLTIYPTSPNCKFVRFSAYKEGLTEEQLLVAAEVYYNYNVSYWNETPVYDNGTVRSINHRGFNSIAPENTLPAYRLSKQKGFDIVECDVVMTKDGIPVLLHDNTINRTARNADGSKLAETINVVDKTYEELLAYDVGIWKNAVYAGTKIPTLEEFLILCRNLQLGAYIELKDTTNFTRTDIETIVGLVKKYGMQKKVSYIGGAQPLQMVVGVDDEARVGFVTSDLTEYSLKTVMKWLQTKKNAVFIDHAYSKLTKEKIDLFEAYGAQVEVYSPNTEEEILSLDPRIGGVTSDKLVAKDIILAANIGSAEYGL